MLPIRNPQLCNKHNFKRNTRKRAYKKHISFLMRDLKIERYLDRIYDERYVCDEQDWSKLKKTKAWLS
jgi:hypothetical protein